MKVFLEEVSGKFSRKSMDETGNLWMKKIYFVVWFAANC